MSHFTVIVVGPRSSLEANLSPFQENNMGDCPKEYLAFHDQEDEYLKEYNEESRPEVITSGIDVRPDLYNQVAGKSVGDIVRVTYTRDDLGFFTHFKAGEVYNIWVRSQKDNPGMYGKCVSVIDEIDDEKGFTGGNAVFEIVEKPKDIPHKEFYSSFEEFVKEWHGRTERDEEKGRFGYWENPNNKWDWYQVGGRWAGSLLIKEEFEPFYRGGEEPNFSWGWKEEDKKEVLEDKRLWVDSAKKGHIDWEGMMDRASKNAGEEYDYVMSRIGETPQNESWEVVRDNSNIEESRTRYHAQPRLVAWQKVREELCAERKAKGETTVGNVNPFNIFVWGSADDYLGTREEFIQRKRRESVSFFAFLKDGKWAEKGKMGWWACVSNENDAWPDVLWNLLQSVPDEETLTVVDCHI